MARLGTAIVRDTSRWMVVQVLPNAPTPAAANRSVVAMLAAERAVCHWQGRIRCDIAYGLIACESPAKN